MIVEILQIAAIFILFGLVLVRNRDIKKLRDDLWNMHQEVRNLKGLPPQERFD